MRVRLVLGALGLGSVVLWTGLGRDARACGGEFSPSTVDEAVTTDHRMILSISQQQTTLWDEIEFTGSPSSFAWVLPIKGTATVGLSADILFSTLDALTAPQVQPPTVSCPSSPCEGPGAETSAGSASGGVTVLSMAQVGPYETVQLASTNPSALSDWLTAHGYSIPAAATPVISAYVQDNFNFLAMKLAPGSGVTTMRPVRVTTQGASPVLPLRMVAIGTGATTGITLWVIADGRYQPQNFPFFTLTSSQIVWDWDTGTSNYDALRTSQEAAMGGKAWQIESSLQLAQTSITSSVESGCLGGGFCASTGGGSAAYLPVASADAGPDAAPPAPSDAGSATALTDDLTTLFSGISGSNAWITRIRSDIAHAALTADLTLEASSDQTELSNIYVPGSTKGTPPACPALPSCNIGDETSSSSKGETTSRSTATVTVTAGASAAAASGGEAGGGGGGGCSASATRGASWGSWSAILGLVAFGAARARRKRRA